MHITHRFLPGLRFDTLWRYLARTPSGGRRWALLPLGAEYGVEVDPYGAWWCVRRCAAVLSQRRWQDMRLPPALSPHPLADEVGQFLRSQLPGWRVASHEGRPLDPVPVCAQALSQGGSALLQLQCLGHSPRPQRRFWVWVVGVEWQESLMPAWSMAASGATRQGFLAAFAPRMPPVPPRPRCLLTVPFGLGMPWSSGYTARVQMDRRDKGNERDGQNRCQVDAADGQWRECLCLTAVVVAPGPAGDDGPGLPV
jgi:hypothetical protein